MTTHHPAAALTAEERIQITTALAEQPGGRLLLFFTSHGLGEAYQSGSRGYGRAHRVGVVLARAEGDGRLDQVLQAAADHFGIKVREAEHSRGESSPAADDVPMAANDARDEPDVRTTERELLRLVCADWLASGTWPVARRLQRDLERRGSRLDVESVARRWDPRLGSIDHSQERRIVLRVAGLAVCPGTSGYLDDFVATVRHLYQRYRDDDSDQPQVTESSLRDALGLDDDRVARVHELLTREFVLTAGSSGSPSGPWTVFVSDDIRRFRDVASVSDYLAVLKEWFPTRPPTPKYAVRPSIPEIDVASLHPGVLEAAGRLFADNHYGPAVFDAFKAIEVRVREMTSLELTGRELMAQAFDSSNPRIALSAKAGRTWLSEQEGYRFLFMGAMQGIRNIEAHERSELTSRQYALELLALASVLMRRLDHAADASPAGD